VATEEIALAHSLRKNTEEKRELLFSTLAELREPTIIYCAAPSGATLLARQFGAWAKAQNLETVGGSSYIEAMREWIAEDISPDWCLHALLEQGIAFHHGALPRHLGSAVVDAFNNEDVRYLFCTSTSD
jgi:replicative superfamily II helicase